MKTSSIYPSRFLKAQDLEGREVVVTITDVKTELLDGEEKPVLVFSELDKDLVANITNWRATEKILGAGDTQDWNGRQLRLVPVQVDYKGEAVWSIRVRPAKLRDDVPF